MTATGTLAPPQTQVAPTGEVSQVVEHLFRHEAAKMVATLTGIFGVEHLTLAEDVVQEALVRALQTWPFYGLPKNPSAWIMRASRNLALDAVRRQKIFRGKEPQIIQLIESHSSDGESPVFPEEEIKDDRLRLMFVCCHPLVATDAQVTLALKTLCGFSVEEIARAFLSTEAAVAKRLTRAKQQIKDAGIAFEIPVGEDLARRLDAVLQCLYLLFNEGYKASSGENLVRADICHEAIRLTSLLVEHRAGDQPRTHALMSLMLLNTARLPARVDEEGNMLRLQEQDRSQWDQSMIARGMYHLGRSAAGEDLSAYHLQAGIAACHCGAADYASTDWRKILTLYERLIALDDSPVVALNRAIALGKVHGPAAGREALASVADHSKLEDYHLLHAVLGEFEAELNHPAAAMAHFRKALDLAGTTSEQRFLSNRLQACQQQLEKSHNDQVKEQPHTPE